MPLPQLHIVKKIKFLVSSALISKKQIVAVVEKDAQEHHLVNQRQEKEDNARVEHAVKELQEENTQAGRVYTRIHAALVISIMVIFVLLVILALVLVWYHYFNEQNIRIDLLPY